MNYLNLKEKVVLLGVCANDEVYIGILDSNGLVSTIQKGKMEHGSVKTWEEIKIDKPREAEHFITTEEGNIYYNDIKVSTILGFKQNLSKKYAGILTEIKENTIITRNGNKLKIDKLN